jgi:hypothetical protein
MMRKMTKINIHQIKGARIGAYSIKCAYAIQLYNWFTSHTFSKAGPFPLYYDQWRPWFAIVSQSSEWKYTLKQLPFKSGSKELDQILNLMWLLHKYPDFKFLKVDEDQWVWENWCEEIPYLIQQLNEQTANVTSQTEIKKPASNSKHKKSNAMSKLMQQLDELCKQDKWNVKGDVALTDKTQQKKDETVTPPPPRQPRSPSQLQPTTSNNKPQNEESDVCSQMIKERLEETKQRAEQYRQLALSDEKTQTEKKKKKKKTRPHKIISNNNVNLAAVCSSNQKSQTDNTASHSKSKEKDCKISKEFRLQQYNNKKAQDIKRMTQQNPLLHNNPGSKIGRVVDSTIQIEGAPPNVVFLQPVQAEGVCSI